MASRLGRLDPSFELPRKIDIMEVPSMLEQRISEWTEQWKQEGRQEGEASLLLRLLEQKFGTLADRVEKRVETADAKQLLDWGERVLTAVTLEDVFRAEPG